MDHNTRTGNKTSQEEKRPCEGKKADHEHEHEHEHHEEVEKSADTSKFGSGLDEHHTDTGTVEPAAKTHSTSYTD